MLRSTYKELLIYRTWATCVLIGLHTNYSLAKNLILLYFWSLQIFLSTIHQVSDIKLQLV